MYINYSATIITDMVYYRTYLYLDWYKQNIRFPVPVGPFSIV